MVGSLAALVGVLLMGLVMVPLLLVTAGMNVWVLALGDRRLSRAHVRGRHLLQRMAHRMGTTRNIMSFGTVLAQVLAVAYRFFA